MREKTRIVSWLAMKYFKTRALEILKMSKIQFLRRKSTLQTIPKPLFQIIRQAKRDLQISAALAWNLAGASVSDVYLNTTAFISIPASGTVPRRIGLLGGIIPSTHISIIPAAHAFLTPYIFLRRDKAKLSLQDAQPHTGLVFQRDIHFKIISQVILNKTGNYSLVTCFIMDHISTQRYNYISCLEKNTI